MRIPVSVGAVGVSFVLALSACGSSNASSAATSAAGPPATTAASTPAGGSPAASTGGSGGQGGGQGGGRAQLQAYRDCLSQHGVTLPSLPANTGSRPANTGNAPDGSAPDSSGGGGFGGGGGGGGGRGGFGGLTSILQDPANAAAVQACASLQPTFGGGAGGGRNSQAFQAYLQCLADNGVVVPTTVQGGPRPSIDRSDPKYADANAKCSVLLPQRNGNGNGNGSAAPGSTVAGSPTSSGN